MRKDKQKVLALRLRGKSYTEIRKELGVPKSTLSSWLSNVQISSDAQKRIEERTRKKSFEGLLKINKQQTARALQRKQTIIKAAMREISALSRKDLFMLGVSLYWGEGYKRPIRRNGRELTCHSVSITNPDPKLIFCFLKFLREVCEIPEEKIKASIRIYEHQNENELLRFWSEITDIKNEKFEKTYYGVSKSSQGKRPFNILPYGTIQIRVNNTELFHKIMGWIEGVKNVLEKQHSMPR